jgi:hypothetical protein
MTEAVEEKPIRIISGHSSVYIIHGVEMRFGKGYDYGRHNEGHYAITTNGLSSELYHRYFYSTNRKI